MKQDVIVINRDDAFRACADAIFEFVDHLKNSEHSAEHSAEFSIDYYAMKMMELSAFGAAVISKLFADEEDEDHE